MAALGNCLRCDCQLAILCPGTVGGIEYEQVVACGSCGYPYIDHELTIKKTKGKVKKGKARIPVPAIGTPETPVHFPGFMPAGGAAAPAAPAAAGDAGADAGEPANPGKRGRGRHRKADAVDFPGQHAGDE